MYVQPLYTPVSTSDLVAHVVVVVAAKVSSLYLYLERHRAGKLPQVRPARPASPGGL